MVVIEVPRERFLDMMRSNNMTLFKEDLIIENFSSQGTSMHKKDPIYRKGGPLWNISLCKLIMRPSKEKSLSVTTIEMSLIVNQMLLSMFSS